MSFLTIIPRDKQYLKYSLQKIPLKIIQNNGVEVIPDVNISVKDLNEGKKQYLNHSSKINTFKVSVIINKDETVEGVKGNSHKKWTVLKLLDGWIRDMTVLMITTQAIDVPDGNYIISKNNSRKQEFTQYTIWNLEFTSYVGVNIGKLKLYNAKTKKAIKKYNQIKERNRDNNKFKKCKLKKMKRKKSNNCCYILNKKLASKGFIKAKTWKSMKKKKTHKKFSKTTTKALKKFQKKYKKKYKLKKTGKMDKATFNALLKI